MSDTTKPGASADPLENRREDISVTQTQTTTRRNLFCIGAAAAVTATAPSAVAAIGRGDDTELLAMIAQVDAINARIWELHQQQTKGMEELLPRGMPHPNSEWLKVLEAPGMAALTRQIKALEDQANGLDEPIRNYKPRTLEGAVAQADFIHDDEDFREIMLANLRRIMEGRS